MKNMKPTSPSRRDFLRTSAAAAGALAVGSSSCSTTMSAWKEKDVPIAPPKSALADGETIRMGIIGPGGMGGGHLNSVISQAENGEENVQVVALAEVCKPRLDARLKQARDKQGIDVDGYRDYKELLARDDIHCVLIASPEHWHAQHAVDAIAAGKDVYLEKPMTLRLEDALWLNSLMQKNPHMRLQVGTQYMMWEKYQAAKKLIAEGKIGKPTFSQTSYCRNSKDGEWLYSIDEKVQPGEMLDWEAWCGPSGPAEFDTEVYHRWRRYRRYSTGIIGDLLVHMMTPMVNAVDAGWPVRVTASGGHYIDKKMENFDQVNLTIEFEQEHTMIVAGSTCNEQGLEAMIRGHEANLYLGGNNCVLRPERIFSEDIDTLDIDCDNSSPQEKLRLDWLACVRSREQNVSQVEMATKIMVIVDLAARSMWEGHAFTFDPELMRPSIA